MPFAWLFFATFDKDLIAFWIVRLVGDTHQGRVWAVANLMFGGLTDAKHPMQSTADHSTKAQLPSSRQGVAVMRLVFDVVIVAKYLIQSKADVLMASANKPPIAHDGVNWLQAWAVMRSIGGRSADE